MSITEAQARRALRYADIPWNTEVDDPRECAWVTHDHQGILGGLAAAFAVGRNNLRQAEDFLADLGLGARRALGLGRGSPCDTTLYRLLVAQDPAGFEETVFAQVKDFIARKVVRNDRLKLGVMIFDGKGTWSRADGEKVEGARQSSYDADGSSLQTFGALRAALTSSSVCPCVGQKTIGSKEGEATAFRELLPRVCDELEGLSNRPSLGDFPGDGRCVSRLRGAFRGALSRRPPRPWVSNEPRPRYVPPGWRMRLIRGRVFQLCVVREKSGARKHVGSIEMIRQCPAYLAVSPRSHLRAFPRRARSSSSRSVVLPIRRGGCEWHLAGAR